MNATKEANVSTLASKSIENLNIFTYFVRSK